MPVLAESMVYHIRFGQWDVFCCFFFFQNWREFLQSLLQLPLFLLWGTYILFWKLISNSCNTFVNNLSSLLTSFSSSDGSSRISSPTSNQSISTPVLSLWVRHWPRSHRRELYSDFHHPRKPLIFSCVSVGTQIKTAFVMKKKADSYSKINTVFVIEQVKTDVQKTVWSIYLQTPGSPQVQHGDATYIRLDKHAHYHNRCPAP